MRRIFILPGILFSLCLLLPELVISQLNGINPQILEKEWSARWISHPTASRLEYGVFHFRKKFDLPQRPEKFIIHVSADNRYRLFVNGVPVSIGPARGDLSHWRFESIDLSHYLKTGKNVLAAVVWNFAEYRPVAQISYQTAFILQGDGENEYMVNTNSDWKVLKNPAYEAIPVDRSKLRAYIVVGPGEKVTASKYPWGWEELNYDDSFWLSALQMEAGVPYGANASSVPRYLVPRSIPNMEHYKQPLHYIVRSENITAPPEFLLGEAPITFPPNSNCTLLIDQSFLTTAYPELIVGGGKGSEIKITYGEALFNKDREKGNRNETTGKEIIGYSDSFLPDGGLMRLFRPLWFRTYRYIQLDIQTAATPLTIFDFYGEYTGYPFKLNASFSSDNPILDQIWEVGWRTARLCAGETYFDCPYYEQLQYVGDTRIQALISLYMSGDDRLMRNAIQQFDDSRFSEGLTASRYPSAVHQVIPPYSLFWIAMIYDYWMFRDNPEFVKSFLPGIRSVLNWYEAHIDSSGMLGPMGWWNFADWVPEWKRGVPPGADEGHSALISLQYAYNLDYAAQICEALGESIQAANYRQQFLSIREAVKQNCWDSTKDLLADTPEKKQASQHTNIMAILVDMFSPDQTKTVMEKVLSDSGLQKCTFYYQFYLFQALNKAGMADRYLMLLQPWRNMLDLGLTTFAEKPEPVRSDCHAWSASPNYDFLATICGIKPSTPGFHSVRISPHLGELKWIHGEMPHPKGKISVKLHRAGTDGLIGEVILPEDLTGEIVWNDKKCSLKGGPQKIKF